MENDNLLNVSVRKRQVNPVRGAHYEIKVNDLVLGRGVSNVSFELPAGRRPKMTIECFPDEIIFEDLQAEIKLKPLGQFDDSLAADETIS